MQADRLLWVVQRMLRHGMAEEASELSGPYAAAVNRLVNQVGLAGAGSLLLCPAWLLFLPAPARLWFAQPQAA